VIYPAQWEAARKASPTGSTEGSPWHEQPAAMIRKTAVRRLEPFLPTSPLLVQAAERDDAPTPSLAELTDSAVAL
jgi:recombinational DNA repair protein RecT